jgi:uncharacterized membrane protein
MTSATTAGRTDRGRWWVQLVLILLFLIPILAGTSRLVELSGGPHILPANPRVNASPVPVVVHIISAIGYAVLGAFQFSSRLRRRNPRWHRAAGRVLVGLGLAVASSALWMTQFYAHPEYTGELLYYFRLAFGSGMAACIVLGFNAVRRRDIARHRAWMTRAYALALGAGTQVFTQGFGEAIFGIHEGTRDLLLGSAWVINLAVAEYLIRRQPRRLASTDKLKASVVVQ